MRTAFPSQGPSPAPGHCCHTQLSGRWSSVREGEQSPGAQSHHFGGSHWGCVWIFVTFSASRSLEAVLLSSWNPWLRQEPLNMGFLEHSELC